MSALTDVTADQSINVHCAALCNIHERHTIFNNKCGLAPFVEHLHEYVSMVMHMQMTRRFTLACGQLPVHIRIRTRINVSMPHGNYVTLLFLLCSSHFTAKGFIALLLNKFELIAFDTSESEWLVAAHKAERRQNTRSLCSARDINFMHYEGSSFLYLFTQKYIHKTHTNKQFLNRNTKQKTCRKHGCGHSLMLFISVVNDSV